MLKISQYVKVSSLEEAYELNQKKNNVIVGGMHWLKMMDKMRRVRMTTSLRHAPLSVRMDIRFSGTMEMMFHFLLRRIIM